MSHCQALIAKILSVCMKPVMLNILLKYTLKIVTYYELINDKLS